MDAGRTNRLLPVKDKSETQLVLEDMRETCRNNFPHCPRDCKGCDPLEVVP